MTPPSLALSTLQRSQIVAAARAAYPEECCGVLLGRMGADSEKLVERVCPAPNASAADRRHHFEIPPAAILGALEVARSRGWTLMGFYHSHPDGGTRPSSGDELDAWPEVSYLIVSREGAMSSWSRPGGGAFMAETLTELSASGPTLVGQGW